MTVLRVTCILLIYCILSTKLYSQKFPNSLNRNLWISAGIENQKEDFRWSIAGNSNGEEPNIFSELIYNPIRCFGINVASGYKIYKNIELQIRYKTLDTYSGYATDIDYDGDNRTNYIPPDKGDTLFNSDNGNLQNICIDAKYTFLSSRKMNLSAGIGYLWSREQFYLLDKAQIPDLNSSYLAHWKGLQFSLITFLKITNRIEVNPNVMFIPMGYTAEADWNLKTDFKHPVSFAHKARGCGWNLDIGGIYHLSRNLSTSLGWLYSYWKTGYGVDKLFLENGEIPVTRMNGAFKKSSGWLLSLQYTF